MCFSKWICSNVTECRILDAIQGVVVDDLCLRNSPRFRVTFEISSGWMLVSEGYGV